MEPSVPSLNDRLRRAFAHHAQGQLSQAEALYRKVIQAYPDDPALMPQFLELLNNFGAALKAQGKLDEAITWYSKALSIQPQSFKVLNNLANALQDQEKFDQAAAHYLAALEIEPNSPGVLCNLGNTLLKQGKLDHAVSRYREALAIDPHAPHLLCNLASALQKQGALDEAISRYESALAIRPADPEILFNLGNALFTQVKFDEAIARYNQALDINPQYTDALISRGEALRAKGLPLEAVSSFELALRMNPEDVRARWNLAFSALPAVRMHCEQTQSSRKALTLELIQLNDWFVNRRLDDGHLAVGSYQPFYLAYHENDNKQLLTSYGALCHKLMGHWQNQNKCFVLPKLLETLNRPIRLGIVSGHIYSHSVWDALIKGWLQHLDRSRFEISIFHLGAKSDNETQYARSVSLTFIEGRVSLSSWVDAIVSSQNDILLFPEVGMNETAVKLASMRLAQVQVAAWGHPETTGLPTIDYFLSAHLFEPVNSEHFYSETLIQLPNLGCCYEPVVVNAIHADFEALGIANDVPLLVCPGTPFKYAPERDNVFIRIAKELGRCQFIFFHYKSRELSNLVKARLTLRFAEEGLSFDEFAVFVPWLSAGAFLGLMQRADVFLDTIGFSGFNTGMQAIECALPIVTREGQFMRGRLASGILKRIGLHELVADGEEQYVTLVTRLATDRRYSAKIRRWIEANRHVLYNDLEPVRALEDFLVRVSSNVSSESKIMANLQDSLPSAASDQVDLKADSAFVPPKYIWQQLESELHMQTLKQDYAPVGLLEMVLAIPQRVLDVGCFCGGTGKWLKNRFPGCHVTGIEYLDAAAAIAATTYDRVIQMRIEDVDFDREGIAKGSFDIIVAADVLEHLYNPWQVVNRLRPLLAPNGAIYISLPNIRNLNIMKSLAEGRWQYSGAGILDITHIRFFTRTQAIEMLEQTGWQVVDQKVNPDPSLWHLLQGQDVSKINRIDAGFMKLENLSAQDVLELFALQFFLKAIPR